MSFRKSLWISLLMVALCWLPAAAQTSGASGQSTTDKAKSGATQAGSATESTAKKGCG